METVIEWIENDTFAWVSSDSRKMINKMRKLAADHPEDVIIKAQPEKNSGMIYVKMPVKYIKFGAPRRYNLTDEQRKAYAERLKINLEKSN